MGIVTLSRGAFSHGKDVAEALAEKLGYACISREILLEASQEFNIAEIKLEKALHDAPSILERFSHGRERYISYIRSAFLDHMVKDNIVYHGLAGQFYLQEVPNVLKVRIIADIDDRIREEVRRTGCSTDQALLNLRRDDDERRKWGLHLYGKDPWDSRLYDMVLHIATLSIDDVVEMLAAAMQKEQFQTTAESSETLKKKALLAKIHTRVVDQSPQATLRLEGDSAISLGNLESSLRTDETARKELARSIQDEFGIEFVHFDQPVQVEKEYVNTYYNLEQI